MKTANESRPSKSDVMPERLDWDRCKEGDPVWALRRGGFGSGTIVKIISTHRTAQMLLLIAFGDKQEVKYCFDCYIRDPSLSGRDRPPARHVHK